MDNSYYNEFMGCLEINHLAGLFPLSIERILLRDAVKVLGPDVVIELRASSDFKQVCWAKNLHESASKKFPNLIRRVKLQPIASLPSVFKDY